MKRKRRWKKFKFGIKTGMRSKPKLDDDTAENPIVESLPEDERDYLIDRRLAPVEGWPKPLGVRTDYRAEAVAKALIPDLTDPVSGVDITDGMLRLWRRQYALAVFCQDNRPDLYQRMFQPPGKPLLLKDAATRRLRCPPSLLQLRSRDYKHYLPCHYIRGQCPFCWGRSVGDIFDIYMRMAYGARYTPQRDEQEGLLAKLRLLEWQQVYEFPVLPKYRFPELENYGMDRHKAGLELLKADKLLRYIKGMTTSITTTLNKDNRWVVRMKRIALTTESLEHRNPAIAAVSTTHPIPLTPGLLAAAMGRVLAYPHLGLTKRQMLLVQERFCQMREFRTHNGKPLRLNLLVQTGAARHSKRRK